MAKLRFLLAQVVCKIAGFVLRNIFKRGTNTPGILALKICPNMMRYYKMPETVICVTGTNGKTTTANTITHILRENGKKVVSNSEGSNMASGLVSLFAKNSSLFGKVKGDMAVLEIDERSSSYIYDKITPTYILCTNLFRDSIKRNGHSEFIFDKIDKFIPKSTTMLLNANDPISFMLGKNQGNKSLYFSVLETEKSMEIQETQVKDIIACPVCGQVLKYDYYHNNHIGQLKKCDCGFCAQAPNFYADNVDFAKGEFDFNTEKEKISFSFGGNLFNVFNLTACAAICKTVGISLEDIKKSINNFGSAQGRFASEKKGDLSVFTMLSKNQNPISSSQSISYLENIKGEKSVVLCITDPNDSHGHEDISWLYDVDFSALKNKEIKTILVGGIRCFDVALCLSLRDIEPEKIKLYPKYEDLEINIKKDIEINKGSVGIYFALYAKEIATKIKKALD
ncbi:MAG: MurT ligase domain-containing protein [Clostridia bacterium]